MDQVDVSIIKYLGKLEGGILVLISITFIEEEFTFDATFFYTDTQILITINEDIEEIIGDIKLHPYYTNILKLCLRKVIPHNELIDNIDPLDVKPYVDAIFQPKDNNE
jgi:hypothetical protein